jgi:Cu(I)/Ag(I) efflux system periplasmic protein CusF
MLSAANILFVTLLLDCSKPRDATRATLSTPPSSSTQTTASAPTQRYSARGTVRSIDVDKSLLWIAHEDIPGYMKAMTMPFVASAALRADLRQGDRVEFSFHDDGNGSLIIDTLVKRA